MTNTSIVTTEVFSVHFVPCDKRHACENYALNLLEADELAEFWNKHSIYTWQDLADLGLIISNHKNGKPKIPTPHDLRQMNLRIGNRARKFATAAWVNTRSMRDGRELDGYRLYVSLLGTETQQTAALILGSIREIDERKDDCGEQLFTLLTNRFQQLGEAYESMPIRDFCMLLRDDMFLQKFGTKYRKYGVLKSQITATDLQGEDILLFLCRMADQRTINTFPS